MILKLPDLQIAERYVSGVSMIVHQEADLAGAISAVTDVAHILLIDVEIDGTTARNDGQQVGLAGMLFEAGRGAVEQIGVLRVAMRSKQVIETTGIDLPGIGFGSAAIGAKHEAARVS